MVPNDGSLKSYVDDSKLFLSFSVNEVNSAVVKLMKIYEESLLGVH